MGGKSTYMRQTRADCPACLYRQLRPGAKRGDWAPSTHLYPRQGLRTIWRAVRSTFMVEMTETANILHANATGAQPGADGLKSDAERQP